MQSSYRPPQIQTLTGRDVVESLGHAAATNHAAGGYHTEHNCD